MISMKVGILTGLESSSFLEENGGLLIKFFVISFLPELLFICSAIGIAQ